MEIYMLNVNKVIYLTYSVIIFCTAIFIFLFCTSQCEKTLDTIREDYKDTEIYQQYNKADKEIATYAQLIATLFNNLDYDIKIDDLTIRVADHSPGCIQNYSIKNINYIKSYIYDEEGNIETVVYLGIID